MSILHPEAIFIQLHTHCNAECINCPFEFTYNKIHQNGRMSESTWKKILTDLINMDYSGQVGFYLHHEPLIDKTLFDKIKDINEKTKAYVVLSTNGQLLNEENILKLIKSKPKKVHLNINSGNKKEYEESMKGLHFETTINNCTNFIEKAKDIIDIEINCPIIEGFDVNSLKSIFPQVKVNLDYWANSRGGLLTQFYKENKGSRFKGENYCTQPSQNFNILFDGSVVACCMDWMHETKKDFMNINNSSIIEVYNVVKKIEKQFIKGDYSKYNMCNACSKEMGFYRDDNKLNILITNHQLLDFTGSEIYTYTLADQLVRNGHNVTIYTKYADKILNMFKLINVKIITNINEIANENFDIAHIHHNIMAIEVRYYFPSLPIVFLSHGVIPFLEQPPIIDLGISKFIAVSEEVKNNLISKGIDEKKIDVIRNIIDPIYFFPISEINEKPQKALIITNKMNLEVEKTIKEACNWLNIKTEFIGRRFEEVSPFEMGKRINKADIVFSLGRGIIEAIMCERVPIIFDRNGGDGIVTSENVELYMNKNFSGRTKNKIFNVEELIKEIEKYNKKEVKKLSKFINQHFGPNNVDLLIEIYKDVIINNKSLAMDEEKRKISEAIFNSIIETNRYNEVMNQRKNNLIPETNSLNDLIIESENLIQSGNLEEAEKLILKILTEIDSESIEAANNLSVVWIMQNKFDQALDLINQILEKNPEDEIAIENLNFINQNVLVESQSINQNKSLNKTNDFLLKYDLPQNYQDLIGGGDFVKVGEDLLEQMIKTCNIKKNEKILDVGCGLGRLAIPFSNYLNLEGTYTGFDIVKEEIAWCNKVITSKLPNFKFYHSDVYNFHYNPTGSIRSSFYKFPEAANKFDFIFLTSVFTHMLSLEIDNYLSEISRVLKPGGRCFITYFLMNKESQLNIDVGNAAINFANQIGEFWLKDINDPEAAVCFEEKFICDLYKKHNLKIIEPINYGQWSGRKNYFDYQDVIIATK